MTLFRQAVMRHARGSAGMVLTVLALAPAPAAGQVILPPPVAMFPGATGDTSRAVVAPLPAFFRSLLLPGWGQAVLDRKLTAGLFLIWEGVGLGMTLKTASEVRFLAATEASRVTPGSTTESSRLRAKKAEREDWIVLMAFNHLFSGLEAYVSAHLWDFPGDLHFRALPDGGRIRPAIGWRIPIGPP